MNRLLKWGEDVSDLIDRTAVLERFKAENYERSMIAIVREAPGVDAVEVVRCKDCKWWHDLNCTNKNGAHGGVLNGESFCSSGKRRIECTDETINAVRDYMIQGLLGGLDCRRGVSSGYEWALEDGRVIELRVTIKGGADNE